MESNQLLRVVIVVLVLFPAGATADVESVMPDFYADPDTTGFRQAHKERFNERIDPFSGTLSLDNLVLSIPGGGGLDLDIRRTYTSAIHLTRKSPNTPLSARCLSPMDTTF